MWGMGSVDHYTLESMRPAAGQLEKAERAHTASMHHDAVRHNRRENERLPSPVEWLPEDAGVRVVSVPWHSGCGNAGDRWQAGCGSPCSTVRAGLPDTTAWQRSNLTNCVCMNLWVSVCVCVCGEVSDFQQSKTHYPDTHTHTHTHAHTHRTGTRVSSPTPG